MKLRFWIKKKGKKRIDRVKKRDSNPRLVLIRQIVLGILLTLLLTGLLTGVWYGSRVEQLTISSVKVMGGETIPHERILEIAEQELNGTYYLLVPKRFALTFPREQIETKVGEIERVKNVAVEKISGTEIVLVFEEYQPVALWCEKLESTDCLFLSRQGYAFAAAPRLEGAAFLRFSKRDHIPELGSMGFAADFLSVAQTFIDRAYSELNLNIIQVEQTSADEVTYHIAGGGELKTTMRMSPEQTIENLETILGSEEFSHIEPGNFQYIDLRYGNKIFVNEEISNVATTSTSSTATSTP